MKFRFPLIATSFLILSCALALPQANSAHQTWVSVGPDGGDVRSLSYDPANPTHIFLGTSAGQIYESQDDGHTWARYVRIGKGNDYVVDHIVFDPAHPGTMYVAAWTLEQTGGEVFKSTDGGHTWESLKPMDGKSVRALAIAPSDPNTLVAGALDGVYRTRNAGQTWQRISPESSSEIKNVESIAIDPMNAETVYAGTWHLPWKTEDGGKTWHNIKNGVIDDSDVFSIIIDPQQPQVVYASACSGIYKSESAGELFHKIQGMPFSARRTRVLKQDPANRDVVYAGTTEGLWRTTDAGTTWRRITSPDVIVNDVLVDVRNPDRVLLATDRSGVLASNNAGLSFEASNTGFAHRQVAALSGDPDDPNTLYAGVINDKQYGGVFVSHDQGATWKQMSTGLDGRDVFAVRRVGEHLLAGTSGGVFKLEKMKGVERWRPADRVVNEKVIVIRKATKHRKALTRRQIKTGTLKSRVTDIELDGDKWIAATNQGIFASTNLGRTWQGGPVLGHSAFTLVRTAPDEILASGRNFVLVSHDNGENWSELKLPPIVTSIDDFTVAPDGSIWLACREGLYRSADQGSTWQRLERLPVVNLASVIYDAESKRMLVTSYNSTNVYSSADNGANWSAEDSGWLVRTLTEDAGRIVASTAFDGVVVKKPATESAQATAPESTPRATAQ
ncbi:MAG TPA: transcriptional regulator [Terriglobales bacterium]|nr:transcriptional regulator [Terriglobales bacterium]